MLVVLPVHRGDANLAVRTLEVSAKLEFITEHQLLIAYPHDIGPSIQNVVAAAKQAFQTVREWAIPHAIPNSWPQGPNKMFASVTAYIRNKFDFDKDANPREFHPFLWMEPDLVPLHKGYLNRIMAEYKMGGKPCLGKIVPTYLYQVLERETDENGRVGKPIKLGERYQDGVHMVGAGVYDRNVRSIIPWVDATVDMEMGFDVVLQGEIAQRNGAEFTRVTPSELIAHYPKSGNYRIIQRGDFIEVACDAHQDAPTKEPFKFSTYGHAGPCMVHGCKDDTIHQIVEYAHGFREDVPVYEVRGTETLNAEAQPTEAGNTAVIAPDHRDAIIEELRRQLAEVSAKVNAAPRKRKATKKDRPEIDEKAVWETYISIADKEGPGAAWRKTISKHKVTPKQLKVIREKNTIPA